MYKEVVKPWFYPYPINKWATIYREKDNRFYAYIRTDINDSAIDETISFMSNGLNANEVQLDFIQCYIDEHNL